jgi:peptidoglycan LD-endopeptidase CwlK
VLLSSGLQLKGFSDTPGQENVQVVTLLKGEQLVPPAPLTPEFFTTPEVEQYRPMLQTANRNWQLLDAEFA